jgi:hypothetical protein
MGLNYQLSRKVSACHSYSRQNLKIDFLDYSMTEASFMNVAFGSLSAGKQFTSPTVAGDE